MGLLRLARTSRARHAVELTKSRRRERMRENWLRSAGLFAAFTALALGCNDLGTCDDPLNGRTPVKVGPDIMYAGQAIMLVSCAAGCHQSTAKGAARAGAPEGLDFDLALAPAGATIPGPDGGVVGVQLNNLDVAGLRSRQRKVFDERELIWEQVDKGLMPPTDSFKAAISNVLTFMFGADSSACPAGMPLGTFDQAGKVELRKWLSCGTPIVETNSAMLPFVSVPPTSDAGAPEKALGALAYAGAVGYQIPACGAPGGGDGGMGATFDQVYNNVLLKASYACVGCHNSTPIGGIDLTTSADIAYRNLLGADGQGADPICATATTVQVKPGDPAGSFFYTKLGGGGTLCGTLMPPPPSPQISAADLELVRAWIAAGAMR
jgi:hypothetical protein